MVVARLLHFIWLFRALQSSAPDLFLLLRHRAYAPIVAPCRVRAVTVLMLAPSISISSRDSLRSASTASPGMSRDAKSNQTRDSFSSFMAIFSLWTKSAGLSASVASA